MEITVKQNVAEINAVVEQVEKTLREAKGLVIHLNPKADLTEKQYRTARANGDAVRSYLLNNCIVDNTLDVNFHNVWTSTLKLYKAGALKAESDARNEFKQIEFSTSGKKNHAASPEPQGQSLLERQSATEAKARMEKVAAEAWQTALSRCAEYTHGAGRNHAANLRGKNILKAIYDQMFANGANATKADMALECIGKIKQRERQLDEELAYGGVR